MATIYKFSLVNKKSKKIQKPSQSKESPIGCIQTEFKKNQFWVRGTNFHLVLVREACRLTALKIVIRSGIFFLKNNNKTIYDNEDVIPSSYIPLSNNKRSSGSKGISKLDVS
nr:69_t:CDS:2 [Entrophospora candida]